MIRPRGLAMAAVAGFVLAGCTVGPGSGSVNAPAVTDQVPQGAADTCGAGPNAGVVGQPATALERVLIMRPVRLIRPDTAVTEDFRPERINFHIDGMERVTAITCG